MGGYHLRATYPPGAGTRQGNFLHASCVLVSEPVVTEDAQLIHKTLDGESAAFGELVRKYQDRLYNTMVHVTGCRDDAQDVVQDAFVQAFVKLDSFQQTSAFYTWLYRIAFNVAISQRRRKKPTVSVEQTRQQSGDEPSDHQAGPSDRLEQAERRRLVHEAIGRLSDEHRTVLVLREIDGCCYDTIVEILELPIGTVRSRLHRARLQLREELREVLILED